MLYERRDVGDLMRFLVTIVFLLALGFVLGAALVFSVDLQAEVIITR